MKSMMDKMMTAGQLVMTLSTLLIAIMAVAGYYLVEEELGELVHSNRLTEKALRQDYRPFGGVEFASWEGTDSTLFKTGVKRGVAVGEFRFEYQLELKNVSSAILVYIGSLTMDTTESISFRDELLAGRLDTATVEFDKLSGDQRRSVIYGDKLSVTRMISIVRPAFTERVYIYTLFFYEDQDGNLYDTEHLDAFPFAVPKYGDTTQIPVLVAEKMVYRDVFNEYTKKEVAQLRAWLEQSKHPMMDYFTF